jgi:hypothetical protein
MKQSCSRLCCTTPLPVIASEAIHLAAERIHLAAEESVDCFVASLLAMTVYVAGGMEEGSQ